MNTVTMEIPPDEWSVFFDDLSREHQSRIVTIEGHGEEAGDQFESHDVPLEGVSVTLNGDDEVISIVARQDTGKHVMHTVSAPLHVMLERTPEGLAKTLHIESAHGATTLVRFRPVVIPETIQSA
ncbi:MAG TPA: DUF5335 family protein [Nitrospiraceae bacterium]|nr:DUF5335 family protein [Nitrospiraceae bacterium]